MKLLVLDNYDSFTFNLVHLVEKVSDVAFEVHKNDQITLDRALAFDLILLSPGPGLPSEAGIMPALISAACTTHAVLGVCLGLQAIGEFAGCGLRNLPHVYHGRSAPVRIIAHDPIFSGCPGRFMAGRYHSWVVDERNIGQKLIITAVDDDGLVMAARHPQYNMCGVQFHPESILSEYGEQIIKNWLRSAMN